MELSGVGLLRPLEKRSGSRRDEGGGWEVEWALVVVLRALYHYGTIPGNPTKKPILESGNACPALGGRSLLPPLLVRTLITDTTDTTDTSDTNDTNFPGERAIEPIPAPGYSAAALQPGPAPAMYRPGHNSHTYAHRSIPRKAHRERSQEHMACS